MQESRVRCRRWARGVSEGPGAFQLAAAACRNRGIRIEHNSGPHTQREAVLRPEASVPFAPYWSIRVSGWMSAPSVCGSEAMVST
jgi:hypothetical protein